MYFPISWLVVATAVTLFLASSQALNIIVNNDDGFAAANIREFYRLLKAAGHNAWIVAPVVDNSGQGGRAVFTSSPVLTQPSQFGIIPAGAPSFGTDPIDSHIWYYNGTPAACTFFALDYVVPNFWNGTKVDLLVAGPNFGNNLGPFLYTLSGTQGATYAAVERDIPAIAFSAANSGLRSYKEINQTTPSGSPDPATIAAQLSVDLVNQLAKNTKGRERILPFGYGIDVNYPFITSLINQTCVSPPFIQTRMTGDGATVDYAAFNASTQLFTYRNITPRGVNTCINGDCSLPGETRIVNGGCQSSVTVFTIDYDAPTCRGSKHVRPLLRPLVKYARRPHRRTRSASRGEEEFLLD
ncbi:hypothetical protein MMC22_008223 [Lobaria immixta]|nr:hypothetical protein [Lobaria immixta]